MRHFVLETARDSADALRRGRLRNTADSQIAAPAQYLAGGTQLLDLMKLDVMRPERLIDISALSAEHGGVELDEGWLRLGALVRMADAADHPVVRREFPVLADSLWMAASPQLRNMGTLGGNVLQRTRCNYFRSTSWGACNKRKPGSGCAAREGVARRLAVLGVSEHCIANYPGDFAVALAALGAEVEIVDTGGQTRRIAFEDLHRLPGSTPHIETSLHPGDLIASFHVPRGPWTRRSLYLKVRDRTSYDFALASAAVALELDNSGVVKTARVGLGGLATKPWRAHEAETVLTGRVLDENSAEQAAHAAFLGAVVQAENAFKPELGRRVLMRALMEVRAMEITP
jgi:xanthine dehydrogenase YagS FAD-binding subunit